MKQSEKIIFPNLNGLRFIAAAVVIVNHIELMKSMRGLDNIFEFGFVQKMGGLGVTLFFVLSGFLITFLLLTEKNEFKTISIKNFYFRRILRIWPLYYLVVISVLFVFPHLPFFQNSNLNDGLVDFYWLKISLYLLILPNIAYVTFSNIPFLPPTWSIGVEEQFYLIWPLFLRSTTRYIELLVALIVICFLLSQGFAGDILYLLNKLCHIWSHSEVNSIKGAVNHFFSKLRIGSMAIGGVGAYLLLFNKAEMIKIIFSKATQRFSYFILLLVFFRGNELPHEFYSVLFIVIILNLAANEFSLVRINSRVFNYLGKISYGLYLFHSIAIYAVFELTEAQGLNINSVTGNVALYLAGFLGTILMADVSYRFYETWFLKWKIYLTKDSLT